MLWCPSNLVQRPCGPLIPPRDVSSMTGSPKTLARFHEFKLIRILTWKRSPQRISIGEIPINGFASVQSAPFKIFKTFLLEPARVSRQNCHIISARHFSHPPYKDAWIKFEIFCAGRTAGSTGRLTSGSTCRGKPPAALSTRAG